MILLDTHAALWALTEPRRLSDTATSAITVAGAGAVAAITWYEMAWLSRCGTHRGRGAFP